MGSDAQSSPSRSPAVISIHAPRVGSDQEAARQAVESEWISIHAPRVGSDVVDKVAASRHFHFNPRSPCGERRSDGIGSIFKFSFQSTLPVWGATRKGNNRRSSHIFQSTLPVWGATFLTKVIIIIYRIFQSTLPVWGATVDLNGCSKHYHNFNPRSPCGERRFTSLNINIKCEKFQSTLPVWGATVELSDNSPGSFISIHAPRVGSDSRYLCQKKFDQSFQSTLPVWGATQKKEGLR